MEKLIKKFEDFVSSLNEGDGFGTLPYLLKKESDIFNYMFQLEMENGGQKGFLFSVGKYSQYETLEGPKNSHAVLNIMEISPEIIEDIAIGKADVPDLNDEKFKLKDNNLSRFMEQISKALLNYLEKNPKVVRIFDEMQDNLDIENYESYFKSIILSEIGPEWSMQEGSHEGSFILSR